MLFSQALLNATYKNGRPPVLTEQHQRAEHHSFKQHFLSRGKAIPKDLYVSRLIQHHLIIRAIEDQLQGLSEEERSPISSFFTLSFLKELWRKPGIESDLNALEIDASQIRPSDVANSTSDYLDSLKQLPPKSLLAHFLLHVAGFMHGGQILQTRYINPSNAKTVYQIPSHQYDFSSAISKLPDEKVTSFALYHDMMAQVDKIAVDEAEYVELLTQCKSVYQIMSNIYDDLCVMHSLEVKQAKPQDDNLAKKPTAQRLDQEEKQNDVGTALSNPEPHQSNHKLFALVSVSLIGLAVILKHLLNAYGALSETPPFQPG